MTISRRRFLAASSAAATGLLIPAADALQVPGERPPPLPKGVEIALPLGRRPVSFIIDDSTCLVNLAHFAIPQFAQVFPDRYKQPWKTLPREIPDAFVAKFIEWCKEHGVKGKYSVVPYPACVGWIDGEMPGWSRQELQSSLALVRDRIAPDWDIHPEMVTHTWVVDTKTGRPLRERSERTMENWRWTDGKSADQIAEYMSYALTAIKNAGLVANGITTPGGFGNRVLPQLSQASFQSCRDVFKTEIPHYFRHLYTDQRSVKPRVELAAGLDGSDPRCVVSIIGCTGDWFGGWDGLEAGSVDQFITADLSKGRLVEVLERPEPAVMVCHWPGIYFNGQEVGFNILKEIVKRLHAKYDDLHWMNLGELSRYWAAKELTALSRIDEHRVDLRAPFACSNFTLSIQAPPEMRPLRVVHDGKPTNLEPTSAKLKLKSNNYHRAGDSLLVCFDLPKGTSRLELVGLT
jgi:hypothetical protein